MGDRCAQKAWPTGLPWGSDTRTTAPGGRPAGADNTSWR